VFHTRKYIFLLFDPLNDKHTSNSFTTGEADILNIKGKFVVSKFVCILFPKGSGIPEKKTGILL